MGKTNSTVKVEIGGTYIRLWLDSPSRAHSKIKVKSHAAPLLKQELVSLLKSKNIKPTSLLIGLRGVWTPKEKRRWKKIFQGCSRKITVTSDVEMAYHRLVKRSPGLLLNAGTGSILLGRNEKGQFFRLGGLGPFLGDEGSAFWLGREYLRSLYDKDKRIGLIRAATLHPNPVGRIAGFSILVLKRAQKGGDRVCREIVHRAVGTLVDMVREGRKKIRLKSGVPLVLYGGLFNNSYFREIFLQQLKN